MSEAGLADYLRHLVSALDKQSDRYEWNDADKHVYSDFLAESDPAALYIVKSDTTLKVLRELPSPKSGYAPHDITLVLKLEGSLLDDDQLDDSLICVTLKGGTADLQTSSVELLLTLVRSGLAPVFSSFNTEGANGHNIVLTRQKLAELELFLSNLQQHREIHFLDLPLNPIADTVDLESASEPDAGVLNSLQSTVNDWKKSIRELAHSTRDPTLGSAADEIKFWRSLEEALLSVQEQLNTEPVQKVFRILEIGKRFHATTGFLADTGLPETLETVGKYNQIFHDLAIGDLQTSRDLKGVRQALHGIFGPLEKRWRFSTYPVWRCLALIEALSRDLRDKLLAIICEKHVLTLSMENFKSLVDETQLVADCWNDHTRDIANKARDIMRKRAEKFIPVRIVSLHTPVVERVEYIFKFRQAHENLVQTLRIVCQADAELSKLATYENIEAAYQSMTDLDVLDLTASGISKWNEHEHSYELASSQTENLIAQVLRDRLVKAKNLHAMLRIFGLFNPLFKRSAIRSAIHEQQNRLLDSVKKDINRIQLEVKKSFNKSSSLKVSESAGIPSVSGLVIWMEQMRQKIDTTVSIVRKVLGDNWMQYSEGEQLFQECESLKEQLNSKSVVHDWLNAILGIIPNISGSIFDIENQNVIVAVDHKAVLMFQEVQTLASLGYHIPHSVLAAADEARKVYPLATRLVEVLETISQIQYLITTKKTPSLLLIQAVNNVYDLLEYGAELSWVDLLPAGQQYMIYLPRLEQAVSSLEIKAYHASSIDQDNFKLLNELDKCPYSRDSFEKLIQLLQKNVDTLGLGFSNLNDYIGAINNCIIEKLSARCIEVLKGIENSYYRTTSEDTHAITLNNQVISVTPPLGFTRQLWFEEIENTLETICISGVKHHMNEAESVNSVEHSPKLHETLQSIYWAIDGVFDKAAKAVKKWQSLQSLWDLEPEEICNQLGHDLIEWIALINQLRKSRTDMADGLTDIDSLGRLRIDYRQVQAIVDTKYDSWQAYIVTRFAELVKTRSCELNENLNAMKRQLEELDFDSEVVSKIASSVVALLEVSDELTRYTTDLDLLRQSHLILTRCRFRFPSSWVYFDQIDGQATAVSHLHTRRMQEFDRSRVHLVAILSIRIETLNKELLDVKENWDVLRPLDGDLKPDKALATLNQISVQISSLEDAHDNLQTAMQALNADMGLSMTIAQTIKSVMGEISELKSVWNDIKQGIDLLQKLEDTPWSMVVTRQVRSALTAQIEGVQTTSTRLRQFFAYQRFEQLLQSRMKGLNIISRLQSEALCRRHWDKIFSILGAKSRPVSSMTLGDIWSLDIINCQHAIFEQLEIAEGEHKLEVFLDAIKAFWMDFKVELLLHQNSLWLIRNWTEIFERIEQDLQSLAVMHNSAHFRLYETETSEWENKLNNGRLLFDKWVEVQREWVYLHGVFRMSEIKQVLPSEFVKYSNINSELSAIMRVVRKDPNVLSILSILGLSESMKRLVDQISRLRRSLSEYFERERQKFCRLYFVGDEALLEILGCSTIHFIEKHINKMFSGISSFLYGDHEETILGVVSPQGETLMFEKPLVTSDFASTSQILKEFESQTTNALRNQILTAYDNIESNWFDPIQFIDWLNRPAQACIVAIQLYLTKAVETLDSGQVKAAVQKNLTVLANHSRLSENSLNKMKLESIITLLVHYNRILDCFTHKKSFQWEKQLRFYRQGEKILVHQGKTIYEYGFEYMGVYEMLVMTSLVEDMFLTMAQALNQRLGGSLVGPAGTGKTESVKTLAHLLGRNVIVFCCDESFDLKALTRLLLGICQTGSWGCFDEFNRLDINTLSAVSTQISTIEEALKLKLAEVILIDRKCRLNQGTAIFITMNLNYAGRNQLPDNLRMLFRQFLMEHPDATRIAEVLLYVKGFQYASELSSIVVPFFKKLQTSLSTQIHYDWGLRALKQAIAVCGTLRKGIERDLNFNEESTVVYRGCCETVRPRLVNEDVKLFDKIILNYFDESMENINADESINIKNCIIAAASNQMMETSEVWISKVEEVLRLLNIHHGFMLVGPAGSGKSQILQIVRSVKLMQNSETEFYVIDPKIMTKEALFGYLDQITREWTDGLFTQILRRINDNLRGEGRSNHFIIFDGDIDPEWAENLNSVLDDNKMLTLPTGERIRLAENVKIVFEVDSLAAATPATVSRCGMVWVGPDVVTNIMRMASGLRILDLPNVEAGSSQEALLQTMRDIVNALEVETLVSFAASLDHVMEFSATRAMTTFWTFVQSYVCKMRALQTETIYKVFLASFLWAFAGDCSQRLRNEFLQWFIDKFPVFSDHLPVSGTVCDNDLSAISGEWLPWSDIVAPIDLDPDAVVRPDTVVPTSDTVRFEALLEQLVHIRKPVIMCGPPGSGKTMTLLNVLRHSENIDVAALNLSKSATPEGTIIKTLEQYCIYKPLADGMSMEPVQIGRWLVLFCDEINLPSYDAYNSHPVSSLLRSMIEKKGFWNSKRQWIKLNRIQFVGACNPPTDVGRIPLPSRFLRHSVILHVGLPEGEPLFHIYERMCGALLKCTTNMRGLGRTLASAMIQVYTASCDTLSAKKAQYIYSPRELTRWCRGLYSAIKTRFDLTLDELVRIWAYEGLRLFSDRLRDPQDKEWTWSKLCSTAEKNFVHLDLGMALRTPILYSSWLNKDFCSIDREQLKSYLEARMLVFSDEVLEMPLTLFDDLLDHALRIDRVLRQPQGHMILMGPSSSGKTTLTRFVCWLNGISVQRLQVYNGYSDADFAADLRSVLLRAGCHNEKICFILGESSLIESSFLERMNVLLANGEVPGLFQGDELTNLMTECRQGAASSGLTISDEDDLLRWFSEQLTVNLHVVFTINSPDSQFASPATTSPALFNRCVLNYMGHWRDESLLQVALEHCRQLDLDETACEIVSRVLTKLHHRAVQRAKDIHAVVTSGEYLSFLRHFIQLYKLMRAQLDDHQRHLNVGIDKLKGTVLEVKRMRAHLDVKKQELASKSQEAQNMLERIVNDQTEAERKRKAGFDIRRAVEIQNQEIEERKNAVHAELKEAEPAVRGAQLGVSNIKKQHLNELRAFPNPPQAVKGTLGAVCELLGHSASTWRDIMQFVRSDDFIARIVNFDSSELEPQVRAKLKREFVENPNLSYDKVNRASVACGPLAQWIHAQVHYSEVLAKIEPLKQELLKLSEAAREKRAQEQAINEIIGELEEKLSKCTSDYAALIADTQIIKAELSTVENHVGRSLELISSLEAEKNRWSDSTKHFEENRSVLIGNCMVAAAFLVYCGYADQRVRWDMLNEWIEICEASSIKVTKNLDVTAYIGSHKNQFSQLRKEFSGDRLLLENMTILVNSQRTPLIIDPTGRAKGLIKRLYPKKRIVFSSFLDAGFVKHVEGALRFGTYVVLEDAEYFDPILMPVLNKEFIRRGGRILIELGRLEIDVSKDFKLILLSSNPELRLPPHVTSRSDVVNFTLTRSSLELTALDELLIAYKPGVERQRHELLKLKGEYQAHLHELEQQLLEILNESHDNLLENEEVMKTLESLKAEALSIQEKSDQAEAAMIDLNKATDTFSPLAKQSARLYAIMDTMRTVHRFYQFSLEMFMSIFRNTIKAQPHLDSFLSDLFEHIGKAVIPALNPSDQLLFITATIDVFKSGSPNDSTVQTLLSSSAQSFARKVYVTFGQIFHCDDLQSSTETQWLTIINDVADNKTPVIFGSQIVDPTPQISLLASKAAKAGCAIVALGSAEGPNEVLSTIKKAGSTGSWVIVQNIHLAPNWLHNFNQLRATLEMCDPAFRLIMTTNIDNGHVPAPLLRSSRLICVERPFGMSRLFQDAYSLLQGQAENPPNERGRLYVSLSWLHSVVCERLRTVPIGWSKKYEFDESQLQGAAHMIDSWLAPLTHSSTIKPYDLPFEAIRYILTNCLYGGQMLESDRVILSKLVNHLFSEKIFEPFFCLSDQVDATKAPVDTSVAGIFTWLSSFPSIETPEWAGLDSSVQMRYQEEQVRNIKEQIVNFIQSVAQ